MPESMPERPRKGDIHPDGAVDLTDLVLLQKYLLCCARIDRKQADAADLNEDGTVDVYDLGYLKRWILNER